jgi:hypothetical protein
MICLFLPELFVGKEMDQKKAKLLSEEAEGGRSDEGQKYFRQLGERKVVVRVSALASLGRLCHGLSMAKNKWK